MDPQQSWIYLHQDKTKLSLSKSMLTLTVLGRNYSPEKT